MLTKELKNWRVTANKKESKFSCYFIDVTVVIKLLLLQFMQQWFKDTKKSGLGWIYV